MWEGESRWGQRWPVSHELGGWMYPVTTQPYPWGTDLRRSPFWPQEWSCVRVLTAAPSGSRELGTSLVASARRMAEHDVTDAFHVTLSSSQRQRWAKVQTPATNNAEWETVRNHEIRTTNLLSSDTWRCVPSAWKIVITVKAGIQHHEETPHAWRQMLLAKNPQPSRTQKVLN